MQVLYDTRTVHPLDRYDYYHAASATELAPVSVHGRAPGRLLAAMSIVRIGDFELEEVTWSADSEVLTRRTERTIRLGDPDCYRIFVNVSGVMRTEQAGNRVEYHARDMGMYDLSRPFDALHGIASGLMRAVMLSFPRACVPIARSAVRPLAGTTIPRNLPGRGLVAQFLVGLTETPGLADELGLAGSPASEHPKCAGRVTESTRGFL